MNEIEYEENAHGEDCKGKQDAKKRRGDIGITVDLALNGLVAEECQYAHDGSEANKDDAEHRGISRRRGRGLLADKVG